MMLEQLEGNFRYFVIHLSIAFWFTTYREFAGLEPITADRRRLAEL